MAYIFRGHLCGFICAECPEPLFNVKVRLYRSRPEQNVTVLAVANPKDTSTILTDDQVKAKQSSLFAEVETDADGMFSFELGEKESYTGEAFEVDVYCGTVPHQKIGPNPPPPRQFTITTLQPMWRENEQGFLWAWDYCLSARFWCAVRALFGAQVICGHVTICDTQEPVAGVKVTAFDADWLSDDPLGSAITDGTGKFRIDYIHHSFLQNIGLGSLFPNDGGPDVHFHIETPSGTPLLVEPPSRGRQPDRRDVANCFCVELCLSGVPPSPDPYPVFRYIGGYNYLTEIDSASAASSGLTLGDHRAFFSTMRLNGILAKHFNGSPMEYTFQVAEYDLTTNALGSWNQVAQSQIARTVIGLWEHVDQSTNPVTIETKEYTVNGTAGPSELVANFTADGWIQVPQESDALGPQGFFSSNGNMINLVSQTLAPFGSIDLTGLVAGNSSTSTGKSLAQDRHFAIRMLVRQQGSVTEVVAGTCQRIAIDNTLYDNLDHHPDWGEYKEPSAPGQPLPLSVAMLDIAQLKSAPCSQITTTLDVLYTAAHPNLGAVNISMNGPGGPYSFTLAATGTPGDVFGTAIPGFSIAALSPCAYVVHLSVQILLTTGDSIPDLATDEIAFCK